MLTGILTTLFTRQAAKAIGGGIAGTLVAAFGPALESFQSGFGVGIGTSFQELGLVAGQLVGGFVVGYAVTWLSPKNAD